jgi:hypothetical protein
MFVQKLLCAVLLSTVFTSTSALASEGPGGTGGGKGILCRNPDWTETLYLADVMDYVRQGGLRQFKFATGTDTTVIAIAELVEKSNPEKTLPHPFKQNEKVSLAWMMEYKYQIEGLGIGDTPQDVPDDNIDPKTLPANCQKVQLAVSNLKSGQVDKNIGLDFVLPWIQRGLLDLHEILVRIRNIPDADTTPIRKDVDRYARLLDNKINEVSPEIRSRLLTGYAPGKNPNENAQLKFYNANKCEKILTDWRRKDDDELKKKCGIADTVRYEIMMRPISFIKRMPEVLQCKTLLFTDHGMKMKDPKQFNLVRVSGGGEPDPMGAPNQSKYKIEFVGGSRDSSSVFFSSSSDGRDTDDPRVGHVDFRASFAGGFNVFVSNYNVRTQLFNASLQIGDRDKWGAFDAVCESSPVEIGL